MRTNELQNRILCLINGIEASENAQNHFMGIIAIIYDSKSKAYRFFQELITDSEKQLEMLNAPENHKYKSNFMVFCHIVLEDYIKQTQADSSKNAANSLFHNYLAEIEKASQRKPGIIGLQLKSCLALNIEEYNLTHFLLSEEAETCLSPEDARKILSVWLMYPELIYYQDRVKKVIRRFLYKELKT